MLNNNYNNSKEEHVPASEGAVATTNRGEVRKGIIVEGSHKSGEFRRGAEGGQVPPNRGMLGQCFECPLSITLYD